MNKKMKKKPQIYNINTFSFYRRQVKPEDLDRAFIKLIEDEEQKRMQLEKESSKEKTFQNTESKTVNKNENEKNESNSKDTENNTRKTKNLSLGLIFPKISIERIMKIRDLFLEFDADRNRTFDQDEIHVMFNMNKIPITLEEVIDLFGFSKKKQFLSFFEFIQLTVNEAFSTKFKKLIMEKIRYRTSQNDICPNDFSDMLSHLCEYGKLSPELKDKTKENQMELIDKKSPKKDDTTFFERENFKRSSTKKKSIISEIVMGLSHDQINLNNIDFMNEKEVNKIREIPNLVKKEKEFRNFMEISSRKFLRFKEFLKKANIRDKILEKKEKVSKSLKILNKLNSYSIKNSKTGNKDFISYYPTDNSFKNLGNNKIVSLSVKKDKIKLPLIKYNNTESNIVSENRKIKRNWYYNQRYNKGNIMKLLKNRMNSKNDKKSSSKEKEKEKEKSIEEQKKEEEYASIFASFSSNNLYLPFIEPPSKNKYNIFNNVGNKFSENTFVTTGLYSNLNKLQSQL